MQAVTVKIKDTSVTCNFPTKWDELTGKQLLYIAKYWEGWKQLAKMGESLRKARALLLLELCGLETRKEKAKLCKILSFVDEETNVNIFDLIDFVFSGKITLTKNLLPKIKVGMFTWYHGPGDRLNDLSIEEFSFAFSSYVSFAQTGVERHLDNLCAILYRPGNDNYQKDGKIKVPFKYELVTERAKRFRRIGSEYKMAVYLFFLGCMEYFGNHKKYASIFRRATKEEQAGSGNFIETTIMMSGGKFGPFDTTKETNLHIFLTELASTIERNKKKS